MQDHSSDSSLGYLPGSVHQSIINLGKSRSLSVFTTIVAASAGIALSSVDLKADRHSNEGGETEHHSRNIQSFVVSPHARAYGKNLEQWLGAYWRWFYGDAQNPDKSVVNGVQLMPLPVGELISGAGTPEDPSIYRGVVEITLDSETPFVLPLAVWTSERYNNGTPDDADIDNAVFLNGISPEFTIDNQLIISDANEAQFYVPPTPFDPIVTYPEPSSYGSIAAVRYQSIGLVVRPLPVGVHRLHLAESYILPGFFGTIFDNTWIVTVKKARHERH